MERLRPRLPGEAAFNRMSYWEAVEAYVRLGYKMPESAKRPKAVARPATATEVAHQACRQATQRAIETGLLKRKSRCERCRRRVCKGAKGGDVVEIHCHHRNYADPLDVEWLCQDCHYQHHRAVRLTALAQRTGEATV